MSRTVDPETGYVGRMVIGKDYGPQVRCARCPGRGMFKLGRPERKIILCLRCAEDWDVMAKTLLVKHGFKRVTDKSLKWYAAFKEFLTTMPTEVDIQAHNTTIREIDKAIYSTFPELLNIR